MSLLVPGYESLANEEQARQAVVHLIDCLPWSPTFAAGPIHIIDTAAAAEEWAQRLLGERVALLGVDTEFAHDAPEVVLPGGKTFVDARSIRPQVCSFAAWCITADGSSVLIRLLFDLRRPEVYPALRQVLRMHVPWVAHMAKAELYCLWACGIELEEHLLIDTFITAASLNLGKFYRRQPIKDAEEEVARTRKLQEKAAHITSLVGQCQHYSLTHPFAHLKNEMRKRFMELGPGDKLDDMMAAYAMADAEFALQLHLKQLPDIHKQGLLPHLANVEWPLAGPLARMEWNGLPTNPGRMAEYSGLCRRIAGIMASRLAPFGIQPGSRVSFLKAMKAAGLRQHFHRDGKDTTKDEVLREAEHLDLHEAVKPFRLHRYFRRLATNPLLTGRLLCRDGRLRCSLDQLGSVSGRIASSKPNLIGMDKRLHSVVEAPPGWLLIELDFAQEEVGIAGAEWQDDALVAQFNSDDAYAALAQRFYAVELTPEERAMTPAQFKEARPDLRDRVKSLVLGMLYGKTADSIAADFKCSVAHAEAELQRFFDHFPQARDNALRIVRASLSRGHGLTVSGLRRFIAPGADQFANAMRNHPIQGSGATVIKLAIKRLDGYFRGTPTQLLLARHDSILLLTPAKTKETVIQVGKAFMVGALRELYPQLTPRVDVKLGCTWFTKLTLAPVSGLFGYCQAGDSAGGAKPAVFPVFWRAADCRAGTASVFTKLGPQRRDAA